MGLPDTDVGVTAAKANMLTIEGWREGLDELIIPSTLIPNGLNNSVFASFSGVDAFLASAIEQFRGNPNRGGSRITYDIPDNSLYMAYDLDGDGLTGFIKVKNFLGTLSLVNRSVSLPTITEINSSIINVAQVFNVHPDSLTQSSGDISRGEIVVVANIVEKNVLTLKTDNGDILLQRGLTVTASAYRSQAIVDLTPGTENSSVPSKFSVAEDVRLNADGLISVVSLKLNQDSGPALFNAGMSASASGDGALLSASIKGGQIFFEGLVQIQATGSDAASVVNVTDFSSANSIKFKSGLALKASGYKSRAVLTYDVAAQTFVTYSAPVQIESSGPQASSGLYIGYKNGSVKFDQTASVIASGPSTNTGLIITQDFAFFSLTESQQIIFGDSLLMTASGTSARAYTSISSNSEPTLQINSRLFVHATGTASVAEFHAKNASGTFSVGEIQVMASAADANAEVNVKLGRLTFVSDTQTNRVGGGNLSVTENVLAQADALDANTSITLRTFNGDIEIGGRVAVLAMLGNAGTTTPDVKVSIGAGSGLLSSASSVDSTDYTVITGYGAVSIAGNVRVIGSGYGAASELDVFSVGRTLTLGSALDVIASGSRSSVQATLTGHAGSDASTPTTTMSANVAIAGPALVEASGVAAVANLSIVADRGVVSIGSDLSAIASNVDSQAVVSVVSAQDKINITGDLLSSATATASHSALTLSTSSSPITIEGGLSILASGNGSEAKANIVSSAAAVNLTESISIGALGEGSHADLVLRQGAGSNVSVNGTIFMSADSSVGSAAGAKATADVQVGKLGGAPIDVFLDAIQHDDAVSMSLRLFSDGGKARLGDADHAGTTTLTLGDKASAVNQLLDNIDIGFSGANGKAIIEFGADQDSLTDVAVQRVLIKGFRLGHDELHFDGLAGVATTARTLDGFVNSAINHFNTGQVTGTTSSLNTVADVLIGGNDSTTYLAYDHDGRGISAIIMLEGISASAYKTANGLG